MVDTTTSSDRFSSFSELQREHTALMRRLRPSGESIEDSQRRSLVNDFIERVKRTGSILDGAERQAAQGILDYWTAEIISASDVGDDWSPPMLLPLEGAAEKGEPPADVVARRRRAHKGLELAATARLWKNSGNNGYLLAGSALEEADAYKTDPDVAELVRASRIYVDAKERERRFRRWAFMAVTALALLATVTAGLAVWQWREADSARKVAAQEAEKERQIANSALHTVSELLFSVDDVDEGTGVLPIVNTKRQLGIVEDLLGKLGQQSIPELAPYRVELLTKLSDAHGDAGNQREARKFAEDAQVDAQHYADENSDDERWQRLLYDSTFRVGDALSDEKNTKAAQDQYERALQIARNRARDKPDDFEWQWRLVFIEYKMGEVASELHDRERSLRSYENGLAIAKQHRDEQQPARARRWQRLTGNGYQKIGELPDNDGKVNDNQDLQEAFEIRKILAEDNPQNRVYQGNLARSYEILGKENERSLRCEQALTQYQMASNIVNNLTNYDPEKKGWKSLSEKVHAAIDRLRKRKQDSDGTSQESKEEGCETGAQ